MSPEQTDVIEPWVAPPRRHAADGHLRRIGVEIEFNGVAVDRAAALIQELFGGTITRGKPNAMVVQGTALGDFTCEIDVRFAHQETDNRHLAALRDTVARLSTAVIPVEIVCPPVAWPKAHEIDRLLHGLRAAGAEGTREAPLYAYGVQLNPELPALDIGTVLAGFRAFLLLRQWLRAEIDIDRSRRFLRFEAPFPPNYRRAVLDPAYEPDMATFIDDYLLANPTRNRELDLLPLLAHVDAPRVRARLPDETIKQRPTWHYRLPNADLGRKGWSVAAEWRRWVTVERLAEDPALMASVRDTILAALDATIMPNEPRDSFADGELGATIRALLSDDWRRPCL